MSLSQALGAAISGLHATQTGLALVAANVANAETPGYVRKTLAQVTTVAGDVGIGVRVGAINRELDTFVQRQLRTETSGGAYADLRAQLYQRLQQLYGQPGSNSALETVFNNFTASLQALATSPGRLRRAQRPCSAPRRRWRSSSTAASADIQRCAARPSRVVATRCGRPTMRWPADRPTSTSSSRARRRRRCHLGDLLDQRDSYIDQLSQLMDIRVVQATTTRSPCSPNSGIQLVGTQAAQLTFDAQGT